MTKLRINGARLLEEIERLGQIGAQPDGACRRLALTDEDKAGRDLVISQMRALGLEVTIDRIGNIFGVRRGVEELPPIMTGSHIDTVATGGKLDGCYGVLAGLEAVRTLNDADRMTRRPICVAVFTNEEGVRFQPDMMGSLVHAGGLSLNEALDSTDASGARLGDELARIGYAGAAEVGSIRPAAFVELHIEQGPVLDREGEVLGAVADLQGISWQEVTIGGVSNHAGTTPMAMRRDAGVAAAKIVCFVHELAWRMGGSQVGTVGAIRLSPNLINVIPREAVLTIDLRNTDEARLQSAEAEVQGFMAAMRRSGDLQISTRRLARFEPVVFDPDIVATIQDVCAALGHPARRMTSGAGHDAQMMARICPTAMIFTPSIGGISHNPREATAPEHLEIGANALLHTMLRLADR